MSLLDGLITAGILAAAGWIFYRSFFRKNGGCAGCAGCSCTKNDHKGNNRLVHIQED